jgi:hypothetical protein
MGKIKNKQTEQKPMPRWDSVNREKQAQRIREQKPWLRSRGPSSPYGRAVSSQNARRKRPQFVSFATPAVRDSDTHTPLQLGDRVTYMGWHQPTLVVCQGLTLKVVGFDEAAGAIACSTSTGKLIWIYPQDLERIS